jgi:hypothetical protein
MASSLEQMLVDLSDYDGGYTTAMMVTTAERANTTAII